jgi:small subunit ribosomal protein S20
MAKATKKSNRARLSGTRQVMNRLAVSKAKTAEKKFRQLVSSGNKEEAAKLLPSVQSSYDKAAKANSIHLNRSSRIKGQLAKLLK